MKSLLKIILLSAFSTITIVIVIILAGIFFIPEIGLHITYPIRVLRGTQIYEGETRGAEVFFIWEMIIIPFIFLSMVVVFILRNKKRDKNKIK